MLETPTRSKRGADILDAPVYGRYGNCAYGAREIEGPRWYFHGPLD